MPPKKSKKIVTRRTMVVQGFNIQGNNNFIKGTSVTNNTAESGNAKEELIIQGFNLTQNSDNNVLEGASVVNNQVIEVSYESEDSDNNKVDGLKEKITQSKKGEKELEKLFEKQRLGLNNLKKILQ